MQNTQDTKQVQVNLTDLHLIDNDMTFDFCESDIKVKICLYRTKDFATKYGRRVKALSGTFTHCRGHNYERWVTLPAPFFREDREEKKEMKRLYNLLKLINEMLLDQELWESPSCDPLFRHFEVHVPCQWSDGTAHMIVLKRWGNPIIAKTWFALTLRNSRDIIESLHKTKKAVFNTFSGSVWLMESHTGYITGNNAEWYMTYERSVSTDEDSEKQQIEEVQDTDKEEEKVKLTAEQRTALNWTYLYHRNSQTLLLAETEVNDSHEDYKGIQHLDLVTIEDHWTGRKKITLTSKGESVCYQNTIQGNWGVNSITLRKNVSF